MKETTLRIIGIGFLLFAFAANGFGQTRKEVVWPKNKEDSTKCGANLNIVKAQFEQNNFSDNVVNAWRWCYKNCPQSNKYIYQAGEDYYVYQIKKARSEKNDSLYQRYIDTLIQVLDRRLELYGEFGDSTYVTGKKAIHLYTYRNNKPRALKQIVKLVTTHNRVAGDKRIYAMPQVQFGAIDRLVRAGEMDTSAIVDIYVEQIDFIKAQAIAEDTLQPPKWRKSLDAVEKVMNKYLTCEVLVPLYEKMMKENSSLKKGQLKNMVSMLQYKGCDKSDVYFQAAERLCAIEPNSACKIALGDKALKDGDAGTAKSFYNEALKLEEGNSIQLATIWLKIAASEQKLGSCDAAISSANKALAKNPGLGKAYIIIAGCMTKKANAQCTKDFDRAASNWVIVDYYAKAKRADPSLTDVANKAISNYTPHFPKKDDIFFEELKIGQSYTVPCIGIATIVRARVE